MNKKASIVLISILALITAIAVAVTVWAVWFREPEILTPDYRPVEEEQSAETIPDDDDEKLEAPEGGGSVSLTYSREVTVSLGEKKAYLYFANPSRSNQDLVIQILVQDEILVQSGTLVAGKQILEMDLDSKKADKLQKGGYEGIFNVLYYDPVTEEKAVINTEIPISIQVKD